MEDIDKLSWFPELITELTRKGVPNAAHVALDCLPNVHKARIALEVERIVRKEVAEMKDAEIDEFKKRTRGQPAKLQWEMYDVNCGIFALDVYREDAGKASTKVTNICWIGPQTWGCTFGDQAIVGKTTDETKYTLNDLRFRDEDHFIAFYNRVFRTNVRVFKTLKELTRFDIEPDFATIRALGMKQGVHAFKQCHYCPWTEVHEPDSWMFNVLSQKDIDGPPYAEMEEPIGRSFRFDEMDIDICRNGHDKCREYTDQSEEREFSELIAHFQQTNT